MPGRCSGAGVTDFWDGQWYRPGVVTPAAAAHDKQGGDGCRDEPEQRGEVSEFGELDTDAQGTQPADQSHLDEAAQ
jgi:hypothetical protein